MLLKVLSGDDCEGQDAAHKDDDGHEVRHGQRIEFSRCLALGRGSSARETLCDPVLRKQLLFAMVLLLR